MPCFKSLAKNNNVIYIILWAVADTISFLKIINIMQSLSNSLNNHTIKSMCEVNNKYRIVIFSRYQNFYDMFQFFLLL